MRVVRDVGALLVGGVLGGIVCHVSAETPSSPRAELRIVERPGTDRTAILERALEAERTARLQATRETAAIASELAAERAANSHALTDSPESTPEARTRARLTAAAAEIDAAIASCDGKKLVALYGELARYGREAWPLGVRLGKALEEAGKNDDNLTAYGLKQKDEWRARCMGDWKELDEDALRHPEAYDPAFRHWAVTTLLAIEAEDVGPVAAARLPLETDPRIRHLLVQIVADQKAAIPDAVPLLVNALAADTSLSSHRGIVAAIATTPGDEADRASDQILASETDPFCREILESGKKMRTLPAGLYVDQVVQGSLAEQQGVKAGDVIVSAQGAKPKNLWKLLRATAEAGPDETITYGAWRGGESYTFTAKGGTSFCDLGIVVQRTLGQ
ncbi:MAG TPA: PDZ domain-containing protein [Planctomycetota bacterium]|nr:PDZ domain-containing protein [Planctomycetota bacterium]